MRGRRRLILLLLAAAAIVAAVVVVAGESRDDGSGPARVEPQIEPPGAVPADAPEPAAGDRLLATGLSERNASLLRAAGAPEVSPQLEPWRARVEALRPAYYRLAVDWAQLQPSPDVPADLRKPDDGCLRGAPPCGAFAGIRDELRAVKSQQQANGGWEVVVSLYGVPDWAARPAGGCERPDIAPRSRPITAAGLRGYAELITQLLELGRLEGVALRWWSPWNEPNQQFFVSPQRDACDASSPSLAPAVYTRLVRTVRDALRGTGARLVLGELAGVRGPSPRVTGISEFVRALPDDVACAGAVWAQHAYVERVTGAGPVGELRDALAERPCTKGKPIWVTETGVGGAHAGEPRPTDDATLAAGCRALSRQLRRWSATDDVRAAFQYTFREDPAFAVGLADTGLTRLYPAYEVWRAWATAKTPPRTADVCPR